jgi:adenylyltransferase/sulfurtransferase
MLSADEIERYARHIVLHDIGGQGQNKLKQARVLVIGAGGLGSPLLMYLSAAGVGEIGIIDNDMISLSNLQRQVIFSTEHVGRPKAEVAAKRLSQLNPHLRITPYIDRFSRRQALALTQAHDLLCDGSDNFATRYLASDAAFFARVPLVTAALGVFDGTLTTVRAHERDASGQPNPTYRCLFPEPPPPGTIPACSEAGILGALPGVLGSLMALEVVREIVGFGEGLVGRLLMVDTRDMRFETTSYGWDENNPLSGKNPTIKDLSAHRD